MIENTAPEAEAPKRLFVDFTDGRRVLRATVRSRGGARRPRARRSTTSLERSAVLSTIDAKWTEHLRDLDEVKEGVGLRAYGQKDPLIEYKMEAFRLFKEMITAIDEEVVGLVFKAGPLVQGDSRPQAARRVREVSKPRLDERRATTQHEAADPNYAATFGAKGASGGNGSSADRDPTVKADPVDRWRPRGAQRPVPVRQRQEVQALPRPRVTAAADVPEPLAPSSVARGSVVRTLRGVGA